MYKGIHASGRFSRKCLEGISFNFFVFFIFNWSTGSAPKKKKHQYLTLYQNWNRTLVYFELAVSDPYVNIIRNILILGDLDTTLTCAFSKAMVNYYKGLVNVNIGDNEAYCWSSHCEVQSTDSCCNNWRFCDKKMTKKCWL